MEKCLNFICFNERSYYKKSNRGLFCKECIQSNRPMVFECVICKSTFTKELNANIPKYCSAKCKRRGKYLNNKSRKGVMFKLEAKVKSKQQTYNRKLKKFFPSPQTLLIVQI